MVRTSSLVIFSAVIIVGCSSSSSPTNPGGDGGTTGGGGGSVCAKIPQADIQALLANPITSVDETDLGTEDECRANGLKAQLKTDDASKLLYLINYGDGGGDTVAVTGVGDEAYWNAFNCSTGTCETIPTFSAHKGDATCYITNDNVPANYSLPYSPTPAPYSIQPSDAAAWAQKLGKVCNDFFSAAGL